MHHFRQKAMLSGKFIVNMDGANVLEGGEEMFVDVIVNNVFVTMFVADCDRIKSNVRCHRRISSLAGKFFLSRSTKSRFFTLHQNSKQLTQSEKTYKNRIYITQDTYHNRSP